MNLKDGTDVRLSLPTTDKGFLRAPGVVCSVPGGVSMTVLPQKLYAFYRDGFRSMVLGRTLWKLIALKLFIIFAVLKLFFFSNFLEKNFRTDSERSAHVLDNLTRTPAPR
jgi:hypothetical protein